jgi:NTP pyrophosphatase (non-canonical NTP hydrolase)
VWAYEYIESTQKEIQEVISAIDAEKVLLDEAKTLRKAELEDVLNRIIKHSDRLKNILPDNN